MASGSQPAVEGTNPGTADPPPAAAGGAPVDPHRNGEPGNGASTGRTTRAEPLSRSSSSPAPTQRPPAGVSGAGLPSGAALPSGASLASVVAPQLPVGRTVPPPDPSVLRSRPDAGPRVVQARRTRRVVRKIDVWTVLKMSFLFYLCVFLVFIVAGVVLWNIAQAFNVIQSVEKFIRSIFDLQKFTFRPVVVLQSSVLGGAILVVLGTAANVLVAVLYNLISDVVGGVQFIVLEETTPPPE